LARRAIRLFFSISGVAVITFAGYRVLPVNATTQGFLYLLLVLVIASAWGFSEAAVASIAATLTFNFYFFEPIGTFTIDDPRNWVALFSFLATSLIVSRLSTAARSRAIDAISRQQDLERLYTFSRDILLIDGAEPFPKLLVRKLADVFELASVVLYDCGSEEFYRAGPLEFEGLDDQLRDAALQGTSFTDGRRNRLITAVRLGSKPIASLALQGGPMPDAVLQGIGNLVAIGLERARAQDLASQVAAARQSEKLRTTLIDAMAHEFKTPLTSIKAATTALLADPNRSVESRTEMIKIADEEAAHLTELIENAVDMARLDTANIAIQPELSDLGAIAREVVSSMRTRIEDRPVNVVCDDYPAAILVDRGLVRLAIKQLLDNALKYSPSGTPVTVHVYDGSGVVTVSVTDRGKGIPASEQSRIFDRLYRSPSVQAHVTGSGLGLNIAHNIARAHRGDLTVTSRPGETIFRLSFPLTPGGQD
jgi:two-component system, OmpR family, sensor histidine kinase KdpD